MAGKNYTSSNPVGMPGWLPSVIVLGVLAGFVALSWYAYRSGTQYTNGDLLVVEADKKPIKEKPLDAGGMQFPNQDKTVFDTFSPASKQPAKVERVLPDPEEPVTRSADAPETDGGDDQLHKEAEKTNSEEQVITPANTTAPKEQDVVEAVKKPMIAEPAAKDSRAGNAESQESDDPTLYAAQPLQNTVSAPASHDDEKKPASLVGVMPHAAPVTKPVDKTSAAATAQMAAIVGFKEKPASPAGNARVQLGAYHSEAEAKTAWNGMQKKHKDLLNGTPNIVKADLGEKGIYYRLQMGGIASAAEAKALCGKLAAAGQACIIPTAK